MKTIIIRDKNIFPLPDEICAAIGNFDGVHLGHQKLIDECKRHGLKSAVLTFYPHPSVFIKKIPNYPLITPLEHKIDIISSLGIDYLIVVRFDNDVMNMPKEEFMDIMNFLNIKSCVCGYDFTFGRMAEGNISDLKERFDFYEIKKFSLGNIRVSSTYVRELLSIGDVKEVRRMLGRTFSVRGKVKFGDQKGRTIGFPTANIDYRNYYIPANGVYFVNVKHGTEMYLGVCNIGHNPTFNFSQERRMEVYIFNFDEDIYDEQLEIFFVDRIRDEIKFSSKDELIKQIKIDKAKALEIAGDMYYTK